MPKLTLRQILFDGSDVAGSPTELFYVIAPLLGCGAYSAPLAWGPSNAGVTTDDSSFGWMLSWMTFILILFKVKCETWF